MPVQSPGPIQFSAKVTTGGGGGIFPGVKPPASEFDCLSETCAEDKNERSYTSVFPYVLMACTAVTLPLSYLYARVLLRPF